MKELNLKRISALFILILIFWWDGKILSDFSEFTQKKSRFDQLKNVYKTLNNEIKIAGDRSDENLLSDLQAIQNSMFQNIRVKYQNAEFLSFIAKIASSMGIKDVNPSMNKTTDAGTHGDQQWEKIRVKIKFRARYHEASRFVNILEQSPYLLEIAGISMQRGSKDPTGPAFVLILADYYKLR